MATYKLNFRNKPFSFLPVTFLSAGGILVLLLLVWSFSSPNPKDKPETTFSKNQETPISEESSLNEPGPNFYDDPKLSYTIEAKITNWDEKRSEWLNQNRRLFAAGEDNRMVVVTGSQAKPCKNPIGDNLLLRFFKNKVDYCRIHGYDIFYNNVLLQPKMFSFWAKLPVVKATMLAHPEAEWIWWVDSDAAFTDMDFKLPLDRYKAHNMVVHGWPHLIYEKKSWTSVNAGVFLIRNCQWSMDFIAEWAKMGPQSNEYEKWGQILRSTFKDKLFPESDDQSGLIYLLLKEKEKWGDKIYIESEYYFEGYWMEIVGRFDNITLKYVEIEKKVEGLRRRHAEVAGKGFGRMWEEYLKDAGYGREGWRRPFITHFTGCQPCSGAHSDMYTSQTCLDAMDMALTFADNQVLRNYGFVHPDLLDPTSALPLPPHFPA